MLVLAEPIGDGFFETGPVPRQRHAVSLCPFSGCCGGT